MWAEVWKLALLQLLLLEFCWVKGVPACESHEFQCKLGNCIPAVWRCDGDVDCADNSDEEDCESQCEANQFRCKDGLCIPASWQCDGDKDCSDYTDELECIDLQESCQAEDFMCGSGRCIPATWRCDGSGDCPDNSDEMNCPRRTCDPAMYQCENGECILAGWRCDGASDCGDETDEENCTQAYKEMTCPPGHFQCKYGECIPARWKCDDEFDCSDQSDEENCFRIFGDLGGNATLPCRLPSKRSNTGIQVKWIKLENDESPLEDVLLSLGTKTKTFGRFENRVFLQGADSRDVSLVIHDIAVEDMGQYRCEVIDGTKRTAEEGFLKVKGCVIEGVVFPYFPPSGRYNLNFTKATQACLEQDAVIASHNQLLKAWRDGLDWCNAGWLSDGSVRYPITNAREPCGGADNPAGLRSYGLQDRRSLFDVFCFSSTLKGTFYWLVQPERLTFAEAVQACLDDGAQIAKVGHIFSAWKLEGYDRCDAGWLADGSVRYPISRPRKNCSPTESAVRFVGFPDKTQKSFGVYCYKAEQ
ncbi:hyaluronan and proteoglycan link protein 1-like [Takifugu rubripes]|uniref:Hyaluronan and proteoglycan link protein 1a n=1 Tax=Takifugu rubripes TaxID=31033 RepID=A0A3B5K8U2_TAKRU|nr:hyaluronan and proteoglycan link protein 1-like [Takifugu rubripes]